MNDIKYMDGYGGANLPRFETIEQNGRFENQSAGRATKAIPWKVTNKWPSPRIFNHRVWVLVDWNIAYLKFSVDPQAANRTGELWVHPVIAESQACIKNLCRAGGTPEVTRGGSKSGKTIFPGGVDNHVTSDDMKVYLQERAKHVKTESVLPTIKTEVEPIFVIEHGNGKQEVEFRHGETTKSVDFVHNESYEA